MKTGTYQYKILAKNTQTKAVEDTADDEINLIYFTLEDMPKDDGKSDEVVNKDQADATMTLNNSKSGKTAETGPGVIIYSIFPIIGYFLSRKNMTEINLNPDNNVTPASASVFNGNKGLLIAIALGLIAVVIGVSTLIGFKSTGKFEYD